MHKVTIVRVHTFHMIVTVCVHKVTIVRVHTYSTAECSIWSPALCDAYPAKCFSLFDHALTLLPQSPHGHRCQHTKGSGTSEVLARDSLWALLQILSY